MGTVNRDNMDMEGKVRGMEGKDLEGKGSTMDRDTTDMEETTGQEDLGSRSLGVSLDITEGIMVVVAGEDLEDLRVVMVVSREVMVDQGVMAGRVVMVGDGIRAD